ncbi:alpha/beta hydrolase [Lentzea aerocolonigenes]|uniref:alpha/beta hydrolase n=1 Tax=Lentzea aerocolonigenes TaxID=68170 RepID=UPI003D158111
MLRHPLEQGRRPLPQGSGVDNGGVSARRPRDRRVPVRALAVSSQDRVVDLKPTPRILMVQSELDVITNYKGAQRAHHRTSGSTRMVSVDDEGQHGQYLAGPSHLRPGGRRQVRLRRLPATDVVCGTAPLPDEFAVFPVRDSVAAVPCAPPNARSPRRDVPPVERNCSRSSRPSTKASLSVSLPEGDDQGLADLCYGIAVCGAAVEMTIQGQKLVNLSVSAFTVRWRWPARR